MKIEKSNTLVAFARDYVVELQIEGKGGALYISFRNEDGLI